MATHRSHLGEHPMGSVCRSAPNEEGGGHEKSNHYSPKEEPYHRALSLPSSFGHTKT
jgi:hypothetical protein